MYTELLKEPTLEKANLSLEHLRETQKKLKITGKSLTGRSIVFFFPSIWCTCTNNLLPMGMGANRWEVVAPTAWQRKLAIHIISPAVLFGAGRDCIGCRENDRRRCRGVYHIHEPERRDPRPGRGIDVSEYIQHVRPRRYVSELYTVPG